MCFSQSTSPSTSTQSLRLTAVRFADLRIQGDKHKLHAFSTLYPYSLTLTLSFSQALSLCRALSQNHTRNIRKQKQKQTRTHTHAHAYDDNSLLLQQQIITETNTDTRICIRTHACTLTHSLTHLCVC